MEDNGQGDGRSRLDRIEAALQLVIGEHEAFRAEHRTLLCSQVLMQDAMEKGFADFRLQLNETNGKLNGLIGAVDQHQRNLANLTINRATLTGKKNLDTLTATWRPCAKTSIPA